MTAVMLRPGQQLQGERGGRFQVLEWAGEGSYARVYRGESAGGPVALKLAKREVSGADARLRHEQEAHTHLSHAAIPACLDSGSTPPIPGDEGVAPWIARQWVEGITLRRRLERDRSLPLVRAVAILLRLADAVALIHARGWSHGDLRPDNILIEAATQQAFLLDLGEAQPEATHRPSRSAGPNAAGGACADLRQLGELLAWCLTGVDPALHPDRLSRAAGFHPRAVQLWQETREGRLANAAAYRDQLRRLAGQLGAGR